MWQEITLTQFTRDSHFVPQGYLRRWSDDCTQVYGYRTLVLDARVPEWTLSPIRGVAYHRDLYTTFVDGEEVDDFEKWIKTEFEDPGFEALEKAVSNTPLDRSDWDRLALFAAAQDLRTPASYLQLKGWCEKELPSIIDQSVRQSVRRLEEAYTQGVKPPVSNTPDPLRNLFRVRIDAGDNSPDAQPSIRAEVIVGRGYWVANMRRILTGPAQVARQHKWGIAEPAGTVEWITSDHPVLRLNYYYEQATYDFKGGWGSKGTDLIFPLSPRHLLYTQVGADVPDRFTFSEQLTEVIQRFLAERAHRWIFARTPTDMAARFRPRRIDPATVQAEKAAWDRWHDEQRRAELPD